MAHEKTKRSQNPKESIVQAGFDLISGLTVKNMYVMFGSVCFCKSHESAVSFCFMMQLILSCDVK